MKSLYEILRLFFCPHRYVMVKEYVREFSKYRDGTIVVRINKCKHCGKETKLTIKIYP